MDSNGKWTIGIVLACCLLMLVMPGPSEEDAQQAEYCRMVAMYKKNPGTGWPDYERTFATHCTPDGKVRPR